MSEKGKGTSCGMKAVFSREFPPSKQLKRMRIAQRVGHDRAGQWADEAEQ
jgi:hypothetical protein